MTQTVPVNRLPAISGTVFDPRDVTADDDIVVSHERVVIGWLLSPVNATASREELDLIEGRQFYHPAHEHIFEAIKQHAGNPDAYLRVLEMLVGRNSPRALGMLGQTPAVYLSDCMKAADCYDLATFRYYVQRLREAHTQRHGRVLLAELARTFDTGDLSAAALTWAALGEMLDGPPGQIVQGAHRNVDLLPFLDGTYEPLRPSIGAQRDDNVSLLYPGLWHTLMAPTTSGKSWFALWHCVAELRRGNTVVYAHFEEPSPAGTIARIRQLAPDLTVEQIREHFKWLDCTTQWAPGEFAKALPASFVLLVLDGINAACGQHGWNVNDSEPVGAYRNLFVNPAATRGAAVLSLGHPVKNVERQNERHGYGNTAWLDEVNGVGFRLVPSKKTPIGKGRLGYSTLFTVKDREGAVEVNSLPDTSGKREGWYRVGSFKVDDRPEQRNTSAWLNVPVADDDHPDGSGGPDPVDQLAQQILAVLPSMGGRFEGYRAVQDVLTAAKVTFNKNHTGPAVQRLAAAGRLAITQGPRQRTDGVLVPLAAAASSSRSAGQTSVEPGA